MIRYLTKQFENNQFYNIDNRKIVYQLVAQKERKVSNRVFMKIIE